MHFVQSEENQPNLQEKTRLDNDSRGLDSVACLEQFGYGRTIAFTIAGFLLVLPLFYRLTSLSLDFSSSVHLHCDFAERFPNTKMW